MRYRKPNITTTVKAHLSVQGSSSKGVYSIVESDVFLPNCTSPAYEADE